MNHELLSVEMGIRCGLSERCPIQDEAIAEANEWKHKAERYEQILKMHNLLKEEPNKYGILTRVFSIDNLDSFFIYVSYMGGFGSILFGLLSNNSYFITVGVLALLLVTIHTGAQ